ncbi:LON peptidase substrate-binding domain-containing protein [Dasania sp. GY-MA-18]|uniref:LON peptidase substrate-binding domain-containing protein n=1 Tax=Dasania phycosphaerae TaxID=2950436 RepID=A0A9J6RGP3_9GAMM|nr:MULTISPECIES: LON peptidase substrate-binding domain-containing protein [Dasania]MCR8921216.1 LON peptidase substrate-binding domain-containing protein [Dasania sp. GY-MA-18]MCZ0863644.1 LON peptidase substrate-binding domain-containing protein [Dasania phycosphaerae]MCZ0867372.1 LON peptidase substrate-binding domain-containing protein [Dasania phycosphaerae]
METIPLFPLKAVLFPKGRMPLQIFEPRYLDLVKDCLKTNTGFGVAWLRQGSEVSVASQPQGTKLADVGTYASIVDWHSLENGLLVVVIEGEKKFRIQHAEQRVNELWQAEVEWIEPEPSIPIPQYSAELKNLLAQLVEHPHIASLEIDSDLNDVDSLSCVLAQLLPIDESVKYSLLTSDSLTRIEGLMDLLAAME